jgi:hypothetical protein
MSLLHIACVQSGETCTLCKHEIWGNEKIKHLWKTPTSPIPVKKKGMSHMKITFTTFFDIKGIVCFEIVPVQIKLLIKHFMKKCCNVWNSLMEKNQRNGKIVGCSTTKSHSATHHSWTTYLLQVKTFLCYSNELSLPNCHCISAGCSPEIIISNITHHRHLQSVCLSLNLSTTISVVRGKKSSHKTWQNYIQTYTARQLTESKNNNKNIRTTIKDKGVYRLPMRLGLKQYC